MKILLQDRETKLFWGKGGWTSHEADAVCFQSALAAYLFSQEHCLNDTEVIFRVGSAVQLLTQSRTAIDSRTDA